VSSLKAPRLLKLSLIATISVIFLVAGMWIVPNFRNWWHESFPPPRIEEVDDWTERSDCIENLQTRSSAIIRAEILTKEPGSHNVIGDSERLETLYNEYQVRVLEVFKGQVELNDIMEIYQYTHRKLHDHFNEMLVSEKRIIFTPLEIGDDLILFLLPGYSGRSIITSQSAYRSRFGVDNWIFDSHDPRNGLILTADDLLEITALSDLSIRCNE